MKKVLFIIVCLIVFSTPLLANTSEELITINTRHGVTQSYLFTYKSSQIPQIIVILFPGELGNIGLTKENDQIKIKFLQENFLVRSRELFVNEKIAAVVMDAPSDHFNGMNDAFRVSKAHLTDVSKVITDLRTRFQNVKIFLIGTSRGTISAAYVGKGLGTSIDGVVLTSAVYLQGEHGEWGISSFPFADIKVPLLLVHHIDDGCPVCPYSVAQHLSSRNKIPLITVHGGLPPKSSPCNALSQHGYYGMEEPTISAIKDWLQGLPFKADVE